MSIYPADAHGELVIKELYNDTPLVLHEHEDGDLVDMRGWRDQQEDGEYGEDAVVGGYLSPPTLGFIRQFIIYVLFMATSFIRPRNIIITVKRSI